MGKADIEKVIDRFTVHTHQLYRVLELSIRGIRHASRAVEIAEALTNWEVVRGREPPGVERDLGAVREQAEFAQGEIESGFPVLHGQAAVALWGLLEAMIEDLVVCILSAESGLLANEQLRRIRIPLAEYESLDLEERMEFLVREYARQSIADLKAGVSRFETLLELVGMSGRVDEAVRRDLFELSRVRNVLVHRSGIADRKLCESCPWLGLKPGDQVRVTHSVYLRYSWAVGEYFIDILERDLIRSGRPPEEAAATMRSHRPKRPPGPETDISASADCPGSKKVPDTLREITP